MRRLVEQLRPEDNDDSRQRRLQIPATFDAKSINQLTYHSLHAKC